MHDQKSLAPKLFVLESQAVNRSEAKRFPSAPTLIFCAFGRRFWLRWT
jgi:hypothetical protein